MIEYNKHLLHLNETAGSVPHKKERIQIVYTGGSPLVAMEYIVGLLKRNILVDDEFVGTDYDVISSTVALETYMTQDRSDLLVADIKEFYNA